jgi:hypothetical protein
MGFTRLRALAADGLASRWSNPRFTVAVRHAPVLAQLESQVPRMEELAKQQQGGVLPSRAAVTRRRGPRRRLRHELLRHLVTVAEVAAAKQPGLADRFTLPSGNATNEGFRTVARKMLEQGQAERELLAQHGLADRLLEDLAAAVDDFDASVGESNQGRRAITLGERVVPCARPHS